MCMSECKLYKEGKCPYLGKVDCRGIILYCLLDEFFFLF